MLARVSQGFYTACIGQEINIKDLILTILQYVFDE